MLARITDLFPLWALLLSVLALLVPGPFAALKDAITPLLGVVMLGMGLTLTGESFRLVLRRPRVVLAGMAMQFGFMPLIGWIVSKALSLPPLLTTGIVLVGACPGGTASNVITYLARGDVALSITLTSISTLLAAASTPLLTWLYLRETIDVPAFPMLLSVVEVVVLPVTLGAALNSRFGHRIERARPYFPLLSVLGIVLIIAIIVALTAPKLEAVGLSVLLAVVLHNGGGLAAGYLCSRLMGFSRAECRTVAIEVGMQNSGLGVALATKYFPPIAALPGALFSIWHNLSGSALAAFWSRRSERD